MVAAFDGIRGYELQAGRNRRDAFDTWLEREFPAIRFERYADDAVVHCATRRQAGEVLAALAARMAGVGLELHPDKTKIVYCSVS